MLHSLHKYNKWIKQPQRYLVPHSRTENEMKTHSCIIEGVFLRMGCIYFQKNTRKWPRNFRHQKSNTKKVPYWGPTHIRFYHTKLNSWVTWCPGFMHPSTKVLLYHGHCLKYKVIMKFNAKTSTYLLCSSPEHMQYDLPCRQHQHLHIPMATPNLPRGVRIGTVGSFPTLKQSN